MLDRLLHRSVVFDIDGDSYRMKDPRAKRRWATDRGLSPHLGWGLMVATGGDCHLAIDSWRGVRGSR
jgi:hypothetical protein